MNYALIFSCLLTLNLASADEESVPFHFPDNSIKKGPYTDQSHSSCFDYFLGPEKIGHEEYNRENGKILLQTIFKGGKRDGIERTWYLIGTIESAKGYADDQLDGQWKEWSENGFLAGNSTFIHGKGKRIVYYDNGNTKLYEEYENSKVNGFHRHAVIHIN